MENKAYALAAGLFTLILGAAVIAAWLWFRGDNVDTADYLLVSRYPVSGLSIQAAVRYRGVEVGKVTDIRFDPQEPRTILIGISVQADTPITQGTYAKLGVQGVTGLSYVNLDDDGAKPVPIPRDSQNIARIEVRPSFFDTVAASGEEMIKNLNEVARRANALLNDENQQQLMSALHNLDQSTAKILTLVNALEPTVNALPSLVNSLEPTIKALPGLTSDADAMVKRADTLLANTDKRLDSFTRAADSMQQLGASGTALTDTMRTESLPRLNTLLEDLQRTSRGLERLVGRVNDQPRSLIFGRSPAAPGPGEPGFNAQGGQR